MPLQSLDLVAADHVTSTSASVLDQIPQTHPRLSNAQILHHPLAASKSSRQRLNDSND